MVPRLLVKRVILFMFMEQHERMVSASSNVEEVGFLMILSMMVSNGFKGFLGSWA